MNPRRLNLGLKTAAVALAAVAVAVPVVALSRPLDTAVDVAVPIASQKKNKIAAVPSIQAFAPFYSASLRAPIDAAPPMVAQAAPPPTAEAGVPVARLELVGTVGTSLALLKGPDGSIAIAEIGDDVDGATVVAIRRSQIDFRTGGQVVTLRMPTPPADHIIVPAQ